MRIQHNIAAMNAYRNYNTNTSAVSKNLEKLSSGYKINRAGDDAAGLAISEKMRAQISGLEAASKNVKDGISLVKTAEGAMQEVQDMLNRMVTLATQSANGTYDNEVDRLNLQKEVDQLRSEINRIADSSNFNGIKLMDGSQEIKTSYQLSSPTEVGNGFNIVSDGQMGVDAQAGVFTYDLSQLKVNVPGETDPISYDDAHVLNSSAPGLTVTETTKGDDSTKAVYTLDFSKLDLKDAVEDGTLVFEIDGTEYDVAVNAGDGLDEIAAAAVTALNGNIADGVGGKFVVAAGTDEGTLTFTASATGADGGSALVDKDEPLNLNSISIYERADAVADAADAGADDVTFTNGDDTAGQEANAKLVLDVADMKASEDGTVTFTIAGKNYNVALEAGDTDEKIAEKLVAALNADPLEDEDAGAFTAAQDATTKTQITLTSANQKAVKDTTTFKTGTFTTKGATMKVEDTVPYKMNVGGVDFTLNLKAGKEYTGNDLAKEIETALKGPDFQLGGVSFTATANGGTLTITMDEAPKTWDSTNDMTLKFDNGHGNGGEQFKPTVLTEPIDSSTGRQYAQASIDLSKLNLKDGSSIQIGNTTYTFAIGSDSRFKNSDNVVDLTDLLQKDFEDTTDDNGNPVAGRGIAVAANRLSKVAASNSTFYVGSDTQGVVSLTEKEGAIDYSVNNLAGADNKGTSGQGDGLSTLDTTHSASDVDSTASDWKGLVKFGTASVSGSGLTLQIGDTSDEYNQLVVSIGDIHTKALGIDGIDISTQSGAQAAIDTIRTAINSVSSIRGTLGATQNRLEHTANNLSVMTENIQDAESTIRDTDIAEEMMAYTKNNILVQSAQAMLAQANQIPQGVLQLLG